jgi:hypothetical protein
MPLETDLSVSPYFDDFSADKDFYKILFRPGVAVQARELNQLQTILQTQIERFGDNVFKRGTIIDGCNFLFYPSYPYIKINDTQRDGITANPSAYKGYFVKSTNTEIGLNAYVVDFQDGFESTDPELKTLYISYVNSGNGGVINTFTGGEVVTVYDPSYPLFTVKIQNGGISFSNNDSLVVTSAVVVNVSSGTFTNGEYLYQTSTGANVQIVGIDTTTLATSNQVILSVRPRTSDLVNAAANSTIWSIANAESIRNATSTVAATVEGVVGAGAEGIITTDSSGKVIDVVVTSRGTGYSKLPYVTIRSSNNSTGLSSLNLEPQNYIANVQISSLANSIGNGYAFGVTEGIVYQKGYFARVEPQTVIVEKYNQSPNSVVVGFDTREEIIDSNIDTSLLDNALGTENENAPGANRMKLVPELVIMSSETAAANDNFFVLAEWSEGRPFKQNRYTAYNKINDEMARRTAEESGNYAINKFLVTTRSPANTRFEGNTFSVVVDPGTAYIDGYRVQTQTNFSVDVPKGNDVLTTNNQSITLDYENYVRIREVGGLFQFSTGDVVKLYDTSKIFITNTAASKIGNTDPVGTQIGTARMRSMIHNEGIAGSANAEYKLYLFDVNMSAGKNFRDTKSVFYQGTLANGVADVVTSLDATLNTNVALLEGIQKDRLVFPAGVYSLKSATNNIYTYRTIDQTLTVSNNAGSIIKNISAIANEYYPYSSNVADSDLKQIYVVPTSNALTSYVNLGAVSINTTSANLVGTGTTFLADLQAGDWIWVSNGSSNSTNRVQSVVNNTLVIMDSNGSFTNATTTFVSRYFPQNVPIPLGSRTPGQFGHSANVDVNGNILTIQFKYANGTNMTFGATTSVAANVSVAMNIERRNVTQLTKTANRNKFVKIRVANNTTGLLTTHPTQTGNVAVTGGSNAVVGTGTFFSNDFSTGERVALVTKIQSDALPVFGSAQTYFDVSFYTIGTITNNTNLTFTTLVPSSISSGGVSDRYIRKVGNLEGPWCLGVSDAFRLRGVYVGNSSVDNTSPNSVDSFYIDHNQTPNYYDLSYLYKKPSTNIRIDADDYLLVEFDYGTSTGAGFFNTTSYTAESDAALVANTDGLPLANLTTKYNTFEIPELYTKQGEYYDLINTFDFRPAVANTVAPSSSYTTAPVNPEYVVSFGTTSDPSNDKKFPVPQTVFKTDIDQYLGRIDSVFVDRDANIFTVKGNPTASLSDAFVPTTPAFAMRLNDIVIKPYPNITKSSSNTYAEILNRRIANERLGNRRIKDRVITTILTQREIEVEQPTGFTMADIGNIERRVSDLEYYVSLSLLETDMKDRVIPSSLDPALNRFKYGFFVDDFSTKKFADVDNPAYAATIEQDDVIPERETFTTSYPGEKLSCDYIDYMVIAQDNATQGNVTANCQPSTVVANSYIVAKEITNKGTTRGKEEISVKTVRMASVSAPVTLYGHFYSGGDLIQIYQGNNQIYQSNSAVVLSASDKTKMKSNAVPSGWFSGVTFKDFALVSDSRGQAVKDSFKISWTHNPANGLDYTIKVTKYTSVWRYALEYPINSNTVSCNTASNSNPQPVVYNGTMKVSPKKLDVHHFDD